MRESDALAWTSVSRTTVGRYAVCGDREGSGALEHSLENPKSVKNQDYPTDSGRVVYGSRLTYLTVIGIRVVYSLTVVAARNRHAIDMKLTFKD